jgi:hypothetical protein
MVEFDYRGLQPQHIGEHNEFLANFAAELTDPGEEFNAFEPFGLSQLHLTGEGVEVLDQADHDFPKPVIWAILVTRYDFVC